MDPKLKLLLDENHKVKSMFASVVGQVTTIINLLDDESGRPRDPDLREKIQDSIGEILSSVVPDRTSWTYVKAQLSYSEYLKQRTTAGTITAFDLVRPGLIESNFDSPEDYFEHYGRVLQSESDAQAIGTSNMKICGRCGQSKPDASFKKGAVCNSCRSRAHRERKKATEEQS